MLQPPHWQLAEQLAQQTDLILRYTRIALTLQLKRQMQDMLGYGLALDDVKNHPNLPVPLHIRNAPTGLMKSLGYGDNYKYAHDDPDGYIPQDYLPDNLRGRTYYEPTDRGYEQQVQTLMAWWEDLRSQKTGSQGDSG